MVRTAYTLRAEDDDFSQPNALVNQVMDQAERDRLVETVASTLGTVRPDTAERVFDVLAQRGQDPWVTPSPTWSTARVSSRTARPRRATTPTLP